MQMYWKKIVYKSGSIFQTKFDLFDQSRHHIKKPSNIEEKEVNYTTNSKQGA